VASVLNIEGQIVGQINAYRAILYGQISTKITADSVRSAERDYLADGPKRLGMSIESLNLNVRFMELWESTNANIDPRSGRPSLHRDRKAPTGCRGFVSLFGFFPVFDQGLFDDCAVVLVALQPSGYLRVNPCSH